ncbi:MAG: hypothetical protein MUC48_02090 [Leptolyngbya sp. Prado105]|nr:hypothetical protein [Leptolyngbya sp. Prado105]
MLRCLYEWWANQTNPAKPGCIRSARLSPVPEELRQSPAVYARRNPIEA